MSSLLSTILLLLLLLSLVTASPYDSNLATNGPSSIFEDTIATSSTSAPTTSHTVPRKVIQILSSCLTATISCTWVAIHPNIEFQGHLDWKRRLLRRVSLVLLTVLAPQVMFFWSLMQRNGAITIYMEISALRKSKNEHSFVCREIPVLTLWILFFSFFQNMSTMRKSGL